METNKATSLRRNESEYSSRTCSIGRPAGGTLCPPPLISHVASTAGHYTVSSVLLVEGVRKSRLESHTVKSTHDAYENTWKCGELNPFTAPEPLPILNPSNFVPKNGFPVAKVYFSPSAGG